MNFRLILGFALLLALLAPVRAEETASSSSKQDKTEGKMISLSDFGVEDNAYLALPQTPPVGGIVLIHDHWGLDVTAKQRADQLASVGFIVIAVDLYNGRLPSDASLAREVAGEVHWPSAEHTIKAAVAMLHQNPQLKVSKVALVGWNWGGEALFQTYTDTLDVNAVAMIDPSGEIDLKKIDKTPCCLVVAKDNPVPAMPEEKSKVEVHTMQASTGFADPSGPTFSKNDALQAQGELFNFLQDSLTPTAHASRNLIQKAKSLFD